MNDELVVMDVGDVLIRTVPMARYQALARGTGIAWQHVAETMESSGVVSAFEIGRITAAQFTEVVRSLLRRRALGDDVVREAWDTVVADVDPVMAPLAAELAADGRLVLASNINALHWRVVSDRLTAGRRRRAGLLAGRDRLREAYPALLHGPARAARERDATDGNHRRPDRQRRGGRPQRIDRLVASRAGGHCCAPA